MSEKGYFFLHFFWIVITLMFGNHIFSIISFPFYIMKNTKRLFNFWGWGWGWGSVKYSSFISKIILEESLKKAPAAPLFKIYPSPYLQL